MDTGSQARVWLLIVVVAALALGVVAGFVWYLDSVGSADGPDEGRVSVVRLLRSVA